jgi:hypothetical protein
MPDMSQSWRGPRSRPCHLQPVEGGVSQLAQQHRVHVQVHVAGVARDQDDAQAEQGRKNQPHGGVFLEQACTADDFDQGHRQHAGGCRRDDQPGRAQALGDEEGDGDAREHGVADGVGHHAQPA